MTSKCPHIFSIGSFSRSFYEDQAKKGCSTCKIVASNLWFCLEANCGYIGCGEKFKDHSSAHRNKSCHSLTINLTNFRVWCYECSKEVFLEKNKPSILHCEQFIPKSLDLDTDFEEGVDSSGTVRGLVGLKNLGNTCYLNAAVQVLSNCRPLTQFFLKCSCYVRDDKPALAKAYLKLMSELWSDKRASFVVPLQFVNVVKQVNPMFRGCAQQDTQEFLRCFMDRMHEELKILIPDAPIYSHSTSSESSSSESLSSDSKEASDEDYETCNSEGMDDFKTLCCLNCQVEVSSSCVLFEASSAIFCNNCSEKLSHDQKNLMVQKNHEMVSRQFSKDADVNNVHIDITNSSIDSGINDSCSNSSSHSLSKPTVVNVSSSRFVTQQNSIGREKRLSRVQQYTSVISDAFNGKLLSSVQCLTCSRISEVKETFQDLSLPIPSKEDLYYLHSQVGAGARGNPCSDSYRSHSEWLSWFYNWIKSWIWGPDVTLNDCLSAFFSMDELKGDNMYSCEKCLKLRNGRKYSMVYKLPEILCIHFKRFRHESLMSKISTYVSFPLENLELKNLLSKDAPSQCTNYSLTGVICHSGTASGGHYISYSLNHLDGQWYEFDDQIVTPVSDYQVQKSEAYVLFYKKTSDDLIRRRKIIESLSNQTSLLQFFISKQWLNKFFNFVDPGPITNYDFICKHGGVPPKIGDNVRNMVVAQPQPVWEYLRERFGGGPTCNHLHFCNICKQETEELERKREHELSTFLKLNLEFRNSEESHDVIYAFSMNWFKRWEQFVRGRTDELPGPIDNSTIQTTRNGHTSIKPGAEVGQISDKLWNFLHSIYGGGPEVVLKN